MTTTAAVTSPVRGKSRALLTRARWLPPLILAAFVLLVHDVGYALSHPFWADESWVAATRRYPLAQLPHVTSSTPIGWSLLTRLFVFGPQSSRLLPLAFAAAAVVVAYLFARGLGWPNELVAVSAGVLAAIAVLMVPAMLIRNDLKQYTADACLALTTLALTSRLERDWSRRGLAILTLTVSGGMLLSHTTAFVGSAAFLAIALVQVTRRDWPRLLEVVVAGAAAIVGMGLVYEVFDAPAVSSSLTTYWRDYYVPLGHGLSASWHFVHAGITGLRPYLGLGPTWLAVLLVISGVVTLVWVGRPMTACAIVLLAPEMIAVSALKKYPLFDIRTSTFLVVIAVVVAAIGVAGLMTLLQRWIGWAALGLGVVAAAVFVAGAVHDVNAHTLPNEDVRSQVNYVAAHRAPNDVILVNLMSNYGFAYYWNHGPLSRTPNSFAAQKYIVGFPTQPEIVIAAGRDPQGVDEALTQAVSEARRRPGAKIWLVRTHVIATESSAWNAAFRKDGLAPQSVDRAGLTLISIG